MTVNKDPFIYRLFMPYFHIVYHQEIVSWIQNPDVDADLYAMFSAVAAPTAYFAAQL